MTARPPLVVAAHGTRDPEGEADAHAFVERVRAALPDVDVHAGFIELSHPPLVDALGEAVRSIGRTGDPVDVTVVPLMLGAAGHAKDDIPEAMERAGRGADVRWSYADVLGPDAPLVEMLRERIASAVPGGVAESEVSVLLVGRGSSDPQSRADMETTRRMLAEVGGYADVRLAYIAVAEPDVSTALDELAAAGARHVVVAPYVLFRGRMRDSVRGSVQEWRDAHPEALDSVAAAEVLGGTDELARLVARRYAEADRAPGTTRPEGTSPQEDRNE